MMSIQGLKLNSYQDEAVKTDKTIGKSLRYQILVLGLVGECGSLLSETKKKQRDASSYLGYEDSVLEELGDALWYIAVMLKHSGRNLSEAVSFNGGDQESISFAQIQPQQILPLHVPTVAFEGTLLRLAGAVGQLAAAASHSSESSSDYLENIKIVFSLLVDAANEAGITLEAAANFNIHKISDRWPVRRVMPALFDEEFPGDEQLPRKLQVDIFERQGGNGKYYVMQRCNGIFIGDRLTDNITSPDNYRFHDAFHYAYAAVLGWSPVTRALFKLKRKSELRVDEGQDSARAIIIEEGIATYVFGVAKHLNFFEGQKNGDLSLSLLKSVRQFVRGYEVEQAPLWLWEEAILAGNEAFRFLREKRGGRLHLDLLDRTMRVEDLQA